VAWKCSEEDPKDPWEVALPTSDKDKALGGVRCWSGGVFFPEVSEETPEEIEKRKWKEVYDAHQDWEHIAMRDFVQEQELRLAACSLGILTELCQVLVAGSVQKPQGTSTVLSTCMLMGELRGRPMQISVSWTEYEGLEVFDQGFGFLELDDAHTKNLDV